MIAKDGTAVYKGKDLKDLKETLSNPHARGKDKSLILPLDTVVDVSDIERNTPVKETNARYLAKIKDPEGWVPLAKLGPNP